VNREKKGASWRFEEITEEDRKSEERLRVEKMVGADKMVDEMFKVGIEERVDHVAPQRHSACTCADSIQERVRMFEKLKLMDIQDLWLCHEGQENRRKVETD
jgi:hypothetical protein